MIIRSKVQVCECASLVPRLYRTSFPGFTLGKAWERGYERARALT